MQPAQNQPRRWYQEPLGWIVVGAIFLGLAWLALPSARRFHHRRTAERKAQQAAAAFARGDNETALVEARAALAKNQNNPEALRIMARMAEAAGSPQALDFRRQLAAIAPNDPENRLGFVEAELKAGNLKAAAEALQKLPAADQATGRYHNIAAGIALAQGDAAGFEAHTEQAAKLAPADDTFQLRLAILRLKARSPEVRAAALATLDRLRAKPANSPAVLCALLRDSIDRGEAERTVEFAEAITSNPGASIGDKLAGLSALDTVSRSKASLGSTPRVTEHDFYLRLGDLQKEAAAKPESVAQVADWMNAHHLALQVPDWLTALPQDLVSNPAVSLTLAESYALASNWTKLKETLEWASWGPAEDLRFAYLSCACERLQDSQGSMAAWKNALQHAEGSQGSLVRLAQVIENWGWSARREELLWKAAAKGPCPRWVTDDLWNLAFKRTDSAALFKLSKLRLQAEPQSVAARMEGECERPGAGATPPAHGCRSYRVSIAPRLG